MKTRKHKPMNIQGYPLLFIPTTDKTIYITCVIRSGYIHETKQNCGISHLLEHVLVSAWNTCYGSCNQYWDNKGAIVNASTDKAITKYYIKGLSSDASIMIQYMASLITNPYWSSTILNREKHAIKNELLSLSNDPKIRGLNKFNQMFYSIEGIQHSDDWKLQIQNLTNCTLHDLKQLYHSIITPDNLFFIVIGDISKTHLTSLFHSYLKPKTNVSKNYVSCFSFRHEIQHVYSKTENSIIWIGFPLITTENTLLLDILMTTLHALLFNELRTKRSLIYDIDVEYQVTRCGTAVLFYIELETKSIVSCIQHAYHYIHKCSKEISDLYCSASIKRELYKYSTNEKSLMDYYTLDNSNQLYKKDILRYIQDIHPSDLSNLCSRIFTNQSLCVYQGPKKMNISWEQIKN
jgi:predicted Zn-dependent peptidase